MSRVSGPACLLLALVAACGGASKPATPPPAPHPHAPPPPIATTPPPAPVDPYTRELDLDFEDVDHGEPRGWHIGINGTNGVSPGYQIDAVDDPHHGGDHSLRLRATTGGDFAAAASELDATPLRGKHVRLHGWIRTDGVTTGYAGLWLRVDGGAGAFDNMNDRGLTGSADWREAIAEVDVPDDGVQLVFGPLLVGNGTAWIDDLRFEVIDLPKPHPIAIEGTVTDAAGAAVAGAIVSVESATSITAHVTTGADGRFHLDTISGPHALSAWHDGAVAAFAAPRDFADDTKDVTLALGKDGGVEVRGRVDGDTAIPADATVSVSRYSQDQGDLWAVPLAADGTFTITVPATDRVQVTGLSRLDGGGAFTRSGDSIVASLRMTVEAPPPDEVTAWLGAHGMPLDTVEAGHGFDDLAGLGKLIGKAHVVGFGEATHGTREFFQMKARALEYLVAKRGFTVFAIEANQPECRAIDDYVLHGTGDPVKALDGIYFWTWNTEEVLAMIEWMHTWNADPKHKHKVQFTGFDMQTSKVAYANVAAYLAQVAKDDAAGWIAPLDPLSGDDAPGKVGNASPDDRKTLDDGLAALAQHFDDHARAWRKATGGTAFDDARHDLTILQQATHMFETPEAGQFDIRDQSMADNIAWLRAHQPKGTRMMLWAHNAHIARTLASYHNMGSHLHDKLGKDYVNVGFLFGQGSFQAIGGTGNNRSLREFSLGAPPDWDLSVPFTRTGHPLLLVDLRTLPKQGVVARWFAAPHAMRETGAVFFDEASMSGPQTLPDEFDAVIFVDKTTRARPLHTGDKK